MYALYTIALTLGGLGLLPRLLWRSLRGAAYHRQLGERFGWNALTMASRRSVAGCLWFHAASAGEVQGIQPVLTALRGQFPQCPVVFSTFTPMGKTMAQRLIPEAAAIFLLPFDLPWIMRRVVRCLRPRALIVQETELWPNLFRTAAQHRVPVVVVNGRLSPRAFRRYVWVRPFMQRVLAHVTLVLAQSAEVARRFRCLGALPERLQVLGNTNIDRALLAAARPWDTSPLATITQDRRVLVGGSTHEGEEAILLAAYQRLRVQHPDLLLILAPRHLERVDTVLRQAQSTPYRVVRRSQYPGASGRVPGVVILDTMGELPMLYRLCTVAFVGGSLVPIGGHNILEPAVFAKPLVFGPHMHHFPELAAMFCAAQGALQVRDAAELHDGIARLLGDPAAAQAMGARAFQTLVANQGALERTTRAVAAVLQHASPSDPEPDSV